jgi:TIR domain/GUN4-like
MGEVTIFISATQNDLRWAHWLAEGLERVGLKVFLEDRDIRPGHVEVSAIEAAIGTAGVGIIVTSPAALTDTNVNDQYAALLRAAAERGLRLIPVLHGPAGIRVAPLAGTRLWVDFRGLGEPDRNAKVADLAALIRHGDAPTAAGDGARTVRGEVLDAARAAAPPPGVVPRPAFVVTYARPDAAYGERLVDWLTRAGLPAWSIADLPWGSRFVHEIRTWLRHALAIVVVMSPAAEDSEDVEREILEGQRHDRQFFPVLLRGDRNFLLASSWYFDARGGGLPGERELRRLRRVYEAHRSGGTAPVPDVVVPGLEQVTRSTGVLALRRLRSFLREEEFAHADLLTTSLLLEAAGRLDSGWLAPTHAGAVPSSLLSGIDDAWSGQVAGRQGFRRQLEIYRVRSYHGADFVELTTAYGWRESPLGGPRYGERARMPRYAEFVDRAAARTGFFPTLRNPQLEAFPAWYDRWQSTVLAVHHRLHIWEKEVGTW